MDDEDELSDIEMEMQNEINHELDGNFAKKAQRDVRGYDDNQEAESNSQDQEMVADDDEISSVDAVKADKKRNRVDSGISGLEKYTKPLREAHSKYLQYLGGDIEFDKKNNSASVHIAFPLNFKKVLMLTLAE